MNPFNENLTVDLTAVTSNKNNSSGRSPGIVAKKHAAVRHLKVSALSSMMLLASGAAFAADEPKKEEAGKLSTVKVSADASEASFKAEK